MVYCPNSAFGDKVTSFSSMSMLQEEQTGNCLCHYNEHFFSFIFTTRAWRDWVTRFIQCHVSFQLHCMKLFTDFVFAWHIASIKATKFILDMTLLYRLVILLLQNHIPLQVLTMGAHPLVFCCDKPAREC